MSRKSPKLTFVLILFLAISFASIHTTPTQSAQLVPLRVGMMPYLDWQPLVVGDQLGYFEEEGIDVEFTYFPDDITVGEAVASGMWTSELATARPPSCSMHASPTWCASALMRRGAAQPSW